VGKQHKSGSRVLIGIEVVAPRYGEQYIGIVTSIAGRESTMYREWPLSASSMDVSVLQDMQAWVSQQLLHAVVAAHNGVQERLC